MRFAVAIAPGTGSRRVSAGNTGSYPALTLSLSGSYSDGV
jgi:hypothetical protein